MLYVAGLTDVDLAHVRSLIESGQDVYISAEPLGRVEQADAWVSVCDALTSAYPGWRDLAKTRAQSAVLAIERVAKEVARLRALEGDQRLRKAGYDALMGLLSSLERRERVGASKGMIERFAKEHYSPEPEHISSVLERINRAGSEAEILDIMRKTVAARGGDL